MIIYKDLRTEEQYYDTTMLQAILGISKSKMKREILLFGFEEGDYLTYNNRFLIKEEAVIRFIDYMTERWMVSEINTYKRVIKSIEKAQ